ncbi:MAG: hypothetical protein ISN29_11935 [Gammaproteobacteria bacterium AqS3]|nr:hypothetical protein [Gammaproteobacteria bacterium AqS3]
MPSALQLDLELAGRIGLEEAVLHALLSQIAYPEDGAQIALGELTPWWDRRQLDTLLGRLRRLRLIRFEHPAGGLCSYRMLGERADERPPVDAIPAPAAPIDPLAPVEMHLGWRPPDQTREYLASLGVPAECFDRWLDEFVSEHFSGEPRSAVRWGKTCEHWMWKRWRRRQTDEARERVRKPMAADWQPDENTKRQLLERGVDADFIESELPGFRIYWGEQHISASDWNTRFYRRVCDRWGEMLAVLRRGGGRVPMSSDWQPSPDCIQIVGGRGIDLKFALGLLDEFRLFWCDSGAAHASWDTVFFRWVQRCWGQRAEGGRRQLRDEPFAERFLDTDW